MRRDTRLGQRQRLLHVETLENRLAMDGNLEAFLRNGVLFVFGDEAGNVAEISSATDGEITITGIDTTVNGEDTPATFTNVRSVVVHLRDGDDVLTISNGGGGEVGTEQLTPVDIERQLIVTGGRGDDVLTISANVGWGMAVGGGLGDDVISVLDSDVGRGAGINGAGGNDVIAVADSAFRALGIAGWAGANVISVTGVDARNVTIDAGAGDDIVELDDVQVNDTLFANMFTGNDTLTVSNSSAQLAILMGWTGANTLNDTNNNFDNESITGF